MTIKRNILRVPTIIILLQLFTSVISQSKLKHISVKTCPGYKDTRLSQIDKNFITIPATRTSQAEYGFYLTNSNDSIKFELETHTQSENLLKCHLSSTEVQQLPWNLPDEELAELQPRNYYDVFAVSTDRHLYSYFTKAGYFYDVLTGNYYDTEMYCVQS